MSILCCGRGSSTPVDRPPIQIQPPKILRRLSLISMPHPQTTRHSIEAFYNEGKELLQARQEESEEPRPQIAPEIAKINYSKDENINGDVIESGRDKSPRTTWSQHFGNERSKMSVSNYPPNPKLSFSLIYMYLTRRYFSIRLPFRSSSANELRHRKIPVVPTNNTYGAMTLGKSMPILSGSLSSEVSQNTPQSILGPSKFQGALALSLTDISSLTLTNETTASETLKTSGATPINVLSISPLNPSLMPSITTTTIVSANETPRTVSLGTDGSITESRKDLAAATKTFEEGKSSNDATTSNEYFPPNEFFSNISAWVRPSTSTFMSFPSSPDPNRSQVPEPPFCVGSTPDLAESVSSKFYSLPETVVTGNTGTSTPAPFRPPTPKYHFRPSMDNASSFYPSCETSRCQSLVGSVGTPPESLDTSVLFASATTYMPNKTPRSSDRVNVDYLLGYSNSRLPLMNRRIYKTPESTTKEETFTGSGSVARLNQSQKRGRDLQRVPRVKPRELSKHPQTDKTQKYNEAYEEIQLQECDSPSQMVTGGRSGFMDNDGSQERYDNDTMISPTNTMHSGGRYTGWIGFPTRVSSLPIPNGMSRDRRNRKPPHAWKYDNSRGDTPSNHDKRNHLRNSVSLGERMWERSNTHDGYIKSPQRTGMTHVITSPTPDLEPQDYQRIDKRAMIRSRSMTLRRTFTNSIAKLRGKVSFSGGSKVVLTPPSPINKPGNKDRFYQMLHGGQTPINNIPEILNENIKEEVGVSELEISSIIFGPTLPEEMLGYESEKRSRKSPENGDATITRHDGLGLDSPLSPATTDQSEFGTASEGLRSRPWSTIYDDCVAFPFADEEAGDDTGSEPETPMSGFFDAREKPLGLVWRDAKESVVAPV